MQKWVNFGDVITETNHLTDWERGKFPNIMLNSDIALAFNASTFNAYGIKDQICGAYGDNGAVFNGCTAPTDNTVPNTVAIVQAYIKDEASFFSAFSNSFKKLLSVGYGTGSSKLGDPLVSLDLSTC